MFPNRAEAISLLAFYKSLDSFANETRGRNPPSDLADDGRANSSVRFDC